jgi:KaiC/GvpD/RAD55 family RecA-like ATPase
MSVDSTIPPNIRKALDSENGYVIVINGLPGTGKSLFAQEIMRLYSNAFILITDSENISSIYPPLSETIPNWEDRHVKVQYWKKNNIEISSQLAVKDILSTIYPISSDGFNSDIIIIDSWTDLIKPVGASDRYGIQQALISAARGENKKIVLVTENDIDSDQGLSHSSDAIILLRKQRTENRMYRELIIEKLRALPLTQDTYLFTLAQGISINIQL